MQAIFADIKPASEGGLAVWVTTFPRLRPIRTALIPDAKRDEHKVRPLPYRQQKLCDLLNIVVPEIAGTDPLKNIQNFCRTEDCGGYS